MGTIENSLKSAIRDEVEIGRLLQRARETGDSGAVADLIVAVGRARKNRMAAEGAVIKLQVEREELIPQHLHLAMLFRLWSPVISLMRALPRKVAPQMAGADDAVAERVLAKAVEDLLAEMHRYLGKPEPEMIAVSFNIWIEGKLAIDPSGALAMGELDQIRAKTLAALAARQAGSSAATPTNDATILTSPNQ
jgi:hypothetical protein